MNTFEPNAQQFPSFGSLDELVEFFDSHDLGKYEEFLQAHFEVVLRRKIHLVTVAEETNL